MGRLSVDSHFDELKKNPEFEAELILREVAGDLALQIKRRRLELKIGQKELAELLGTTQSRVSQLEDPLYGKLTLSTLAKLAPVLKCRLNVGLEPLDFLASTTPDFTCVAAEDDVATNVQKSTLFPVRRSNNVQRKSA
jgi:transcriptional regulator with XRE-family HTH domain